MSAFRVTIDVNERGELAVNAPVPPAVTARVLREALATVERDLLVAAVRAAIAHEQRVELIRPNGAPI